MEQQAAAVRRPGPARRLYDWVLSLAERKNALWWLAALSFAEASFFPIPPDVLLIPLCLGAATRAYKFALVCSIASVLGGAAGYCIGMGAWTSLGPFFYDYVPGITVEGFESFQTTYNEHGWVVVFAAGFSPIPFKIFTIASGVFSMPFVPFILASAVSRSARFFLVAWLLVRWGEPMKNWIDKHFNFVALAFVVLLVGGFAVAKLWLGH